MRPRRSVHTRLDALRAEHGVSPRLPAVHPPRRVRARLEAAVLPWPAEVVWTASIGAVTTIAVTVAVLGGLVAGLACSGATVVALVAVLGALAGREAALVDRALPDALEATARGLRSGASLHLALDEAAGASSPVVGRGLARVVRDAAAGQPLVRCIDRWSVTTPGDGVRLAAAALALAAELGGGTARALDHVAGTLRDRAGVHREIRALGSQARASAVVIGVAPVGFAALAAATDRTILAFLTESPAGLACLAGGLLLDVTGAWWMHRIAAVEL